MEETPTKTQSGALDKASRVVLDIRSLTQYPEKCSGSPKMAKIFSRKGPNRMEKQNGDDLEPDDSSKKIVIKVACSQIDQLKQAPTSSKALVAGLTNVASLMEYEDGRSKRYNRLRTIHPRNILLLFATMSSMGTMLLIYFTLASTQSGA